MKYDLLIEIENKLKLNEKLKEFIYTIIKEIDSNIDVIPGTVKIENKDEPKIIKISCKKKTKIEIKIDSFVEDNIKIEIIIKGIYKEVTLYIDKNNINIKGYNLQKNGIYFIESTHEDDKIKYYDKESVKYLLKNGLELKDESCFKYLGLIPDDETLYTVYQSDKISFALDFYKAKILQSKTETKKLEFKNKNNRIQ